MSLFKAWRYAASVDVLDVRELKRAGVRLILLDRDNTCVPRDTHVAPPEVAAWLDAARAEGIELCIVSNNFHTTQVAASAEQLGVEFVDHAMKPAPFALRRAMERSGVGPHETIMVGDQVFTDVCAANLAGVRAVLVRPQCRRDLWYTQVFRIFERLALRGAVFEGE